MLTHKNKIVSSCSTPVNKLVARENRAKIEKQDLFAFFNQDLQLKEVAVAEELTCDKAGLSQEDVLLMLMHMLWRRMEFCP